MKYIYTRVGIFHLYTTERVTIRILSYFRKMNQIICREKITIPKIQYMLINLEGFIHEPSWGIIV